MNSYRSLRKQNKGNWLAVVSLTMCVILSATVLFSRMAAFITPDPRHYIPLTKSGGITTVTVGQRNALGGVDFREEGYHPGNHRLLAASPGFQVYDTDTVWSGNTEVEIFRVSYKNGSGRVSVNSANGEKLLAPGTANQYQFALENTGNVALQYTLSMEAYFSSEKTPIPVRARVADYQGNYLLGSGEEMADVLELNGVQKEGTIRAGYVMPYTLEWEWPFDENDEYDTMLGDLAVEEDISLTIVIRTTASYTPEPGGGIPKTGDDMPIGLLLCVMAGSAAGLVVLLVPRKKREEEA